MPGRKPRPAKDLPCKKYSIRRLWTYPALRAQIRECCAAFTRQDEFLRDASADDGDASQTKLKETVYDDGSCRTLRANLLSRHTCGNACSSFPALPGLRRRSNRLEQEC